MEKKLLSKDEFVNQKYNKINEQRWHDDDENDFSDDDYGNDARFRNNLTKKKVKDEKEKKEIKHFEVGDVIVLVDNKKSSKIPEDAWEFLMTYKRYVVRKVTEKGNLDLGCRITKNTPEGGDAKFFLFGPNRFELESKKLDDEEKALEEQRLKVEAEQKRLEEQKERIKAEKEKLKTGKRDDLPPENKYKTRSSEEKSPEETLFDEISPVVKTVKRGRPPKKDRLPPENHTNDKEVWM